MNALSSTDQLKPQPTPSPLLSSLSGKRVVVGLSGGVDSSVAAYLLQQQGYEVVGLFMKNWHDDSVTISNECPWLDDSNDALIVGQQLGIPFQTLDLSAEYKTRIVNYMFAQYEVGRTPNPDVLCNREIKFDIFLNAALKLGADYIATGHYCRKSILQQGNKTIYQLFAGKDTTKDQSYFLCQLNQKQLEKVLFPIGELAKHEVRAIAKKANLSIAEKKDSQGLCFVGKVHLPDFLQQQLKPKKGNVIEIPANASVFTHSLNQSDLIEQTNPYVFSPDMGKIVGQHNGSHFYTIGQRRGLNIGGYEKPLYVIGIDTRANILYTGSSDTHPGLYRKGLFISASHEHWVREDLKLAIGKQQNYWVRIRYRQPLEKCTLYKKQEGIYIIFDHLQRGITSGQFAAWYIGEELIGSGEIV